MAVWPQTDCKKILVEFKFGIDVLCPFIKERCHLLLEVLEQSHEFANLRGIKCASAKLATCTVVCRGFWMVGAKSATTCITSLYITYKIILAYFILAVSTPTAKSPNLILHQIFQLYSNFFPLFLTKYRMLLSLPSPISSRWRL